MFLFNCNSFNSCRRVPFWHRRSTHRGTSIHHWRVRIMHYCNAHIFCLQQDTDSITCWSRRTWYGALEKSLVLELVNHVVAMASICLCIAAALMSSSTLGLTQSYKVDSSEWNEHSNVDVSVNLTTAVREVARRFVSITLDSSLVQCHWHHFDFRYDIPIYCY